MQVVGFSGTNDNRSLLPLQVRAQDTEDATIKGTNGRMVHLLLQPGKCSFARLSSAEDQDPNIPQRVLDLAVRERADALIDAGAPASAAMPSRLSGAWGASRARPCCAFRWTALLNPAVCQACARVLIM